MQMLMQLYWTKNENLDTTQNDPQLGNKENTI